MLTETDNDEKKIKELPARVQAASKKHGRNLRYALVDAQPQQSASKKLPATKATLKKLKPKGRSASARSKYTFPKRPVSLRGKRVPP
jgi:hypothetical protein